MSTPGVCESKLLCPRGPTLVSDPEFHEFPGGLRTNVDFGEFRPFALFVYPQNRTGLNISQRKTPRYSIAEQTMQGSAVVLCGNLFGGFLHCVRPRANSDEVGQELSPTALNACCAISRKVCRGLARDHGGESTGERPLRSRPYTLSRLSGD